MKILKVISIVIVLFAVSCSSPESKLKGTWKVEDVDAQFDEGTMTPAMVSQVVEMQKETYFRILNDSVLIIVSPDNTYEAKWVLNEENNVINYFFEGMETSINELGILVGGQIVSTTTTPIGEMVITYGKEK